MSDWVPLLRADDLKAGDRVRYASKAGNNAYSVFMVTKCYGSRATAVKTVDITNPPEWEVLRIATGGAS